MKNIEDYLNTFNKNLDLTSNSGNNPDYFVNIDNYSPKVKVRYNPYKAIISKIFLSSSLIILTFSLILLFIMKSNFAILNPVSEFIFSNIFPIRFENERNYLNIVDINYIELSNDELLQIGIEKKGNNITFITESLMKEYYLTKNNAIADSIRNLQESNQNDNIQYSIISMKKLHQKGYDTTKTQLIKYKDNISFYGASSDMLQYSGWEHDKFSSFSPVSYQYYSYSTANYKESYLSNNYSSPLINDYKQSLDSITDGFTNYQEQRRLEKMGILSKLIPVKITLYNTERYKPEGKKYTIAKTDIILWFIPTDEFLNALPERFGLQIRNEIEIIEKIESGNIESKEVCKELNANESIIGICLNYHDNLEIKAIYPSPGKEDTHIKFTNGKEQKLTVIIFDMTGKEIKQICDRKTFTIGEHDLWLDLSHFNQGIYIAVIIDEDGNVISSKFMKE